MSLRKIFAGSPFALEEISDGIHAETVDAPIHPVGHHLEDFLADLGVVIIKVGLMAVETMPVILAGQGIIGPVRFKGILEDDASPLVLIRGLAPDIVVPVGRKRVAPGLLEPGMLIR